MPSPLMPGARPVAEKSAEPDSDVLATVATVAFNVWLKIRIELIASGPLRTITRPRSSI